MNKQELLEELKEVEQELSDKIDILENGEGVRVREARLRRYKTAHECISHYRTLLNKLKLPKQNDLLLSYAQAIYAIREYFNV